jgi:hypothetical protein
MTNVLAKLRADNNGKVPKYAWPGGYPIYYVTRDGGALCPDCVNDPRNPVHDNGRNDGWLVDAYDVNYEQHDLMCDHCNKQIEAAYPEDE